MVWFLYDRDLRYESLSIEILKLKGFGIGKNLWQ